MHKRFLNAFFVVILLTFTTEGIACQCGGRPPVAKQYGDAAIVFTGRVETVRDRWSAFAKLWLKIRRFFDEAAEPEVNMRRYCTDFGMEVTFSVEDAWKGVSSRQISLLTGRGGGDCGVEFKRGERYVVYAYPRHGDGCQTDICTRTREAAYASEDLAFLAHRTKQVLP